MTARVMADVVAESVRSTLRQLPPDVLQALDRHGIPLADLGRAIGNNAAQAIADIAANLIEIGHIEDAKALLTHAAGCDCRRGDAVARAIDNLAAVVDLGLRQIVGILTPDRPPIDGVDQHAPSEPANVELREVRDA